MATANYVLIDGVPYSPKHPLAKALSNLKRGREMQDEKAQELYAEMGLKPAKRLRQSSKDYENNPEREVSNSEPQCDQEAARTNKRGRNQFPEWSGAEIEILKAAYLSKDPELIHNLPKFLKRTSASVACKAGALGVSFERGKYPRPPAVPRQSKATMTDAERHEFRVQTKKQWHTENPHPMAGKPVSQETRQKISDANRGRKESPEKVLRMLQTKAKNGTMAPTWNGRSWKAGWREIGGQRIYARSRWEANYARYLEFLKQAGEIQKWEHEPETFWFLEIKRGSRSYLPDFRVTTKAGATEYHECKGWMDQRSKTKIKRMAKYHPNVLLIVRDADWFRANRLKLRGLIQGWEDSKC